MNELKVRHETKTAFFEYVIPASSFLSLLAFDISFTRFILIIQKFESLYFIANFNRFEDK